VTNSWTDPQGTGRFICLEPPGGDGDGTGMHPNVYCGMPWPLPQPESPAMPSVTIGTSDLAIEVWALRKIGNSPGEDEQFWTGLLVNGSGDIPDYAAVFRWNVAAGNTQAHFNGTPGTGAGFSLGAYTPTRPGLWHHFAINCDRSGNMEFFIDGDSQGTVDISADVGDSIPAADFHPLTSDNIALHDGAVDDWTAYPIFPVIVGPVAVHKRLLTAAELRNSYQFRTTQNISTANTAARFNFTDVEGEDDWDMNADHVINGIRAAIPCPIGVPRGTAGTVKILDSSGNENHLLLPVRSSYGTTFDSDFEQEAGEKSIFALGAHPFFR